MKKTIIIFCMLIACLIPSAFAIDFNGFNDFSQSCCTPQITYTSWSSWQNISCLADGTMNQTRFKVRYDAHNCGVIQNTTIYEYRHKLKCAINACNPNMVYTDWSDWQNLPCVDNGIQNQSRSRVSYDANNCNNISNTTEYEYNAIAGCFVAECSDGMDNDSDNLVDFPLDPGCISANDNNEQDPVVTCNEDIECGEITSNRSCNNLNYYSEFTIPVCNNPGTVDSYCSFSSEMIVERCNNICSTEMGCDYTECSDSQDNDNDNNVDFPTDLDCSSYEDNSESNVTTECNQDFDCGEMTTFQFCNGLEYVSNLYVPKCNNPGTEDSYCSLETMNERYTCNYICSNVSGCDFTQCSDSFDNDNDTTIDFPVDLGCVDYYDNNESDGTVNCTISSDCGSATNSSVCSDNSFVTTTLTPVCNNAGTESSYCSVSESNATSSCNNICSNESGCDYTECSDKFDNDNDSTIDFPQDLGCVDYYDNNESDGTVNCTIDSDCGTSISSSVCSDNSFVTTTMTPVCNNAGTESSYCSVSESNATSSCNNICSNESGCDYTECSDSNDNDQDTYTDFPSDLGCDSYIDNNESDGMVVCSTDLDCGDSSTATYCEGLIFTTSVTIPKCMDAGTEHSYCSNETAVGHMECSNICGNTEGCDYTECSDSIDNDNDSTIDFPADLGCVDYYDNNESDGAITCTQDLDCGSSIITNECHHDLHFATIIVEPKCINQGTEKSYCMNNTSMSHIVCSNICSNESGCDYTECSDKLDNDNDSTIDFPSDLGCNDYYDNNESDGNVTCTVNSDCGETTYSSSCSENTFMTATLTPICNNAGTESSYCTVSESTSSESCDNICSSTEGCDYTECSDSADNDADSTIDFPQDLGCVDYYDNDESDGDVTCNSNADCGDQESTTSCSGLNFVTTTTSNTCMNAGTEASYCTSTVSNSSEECSNICSNSYGCDYTECSDMTDNDQDSFIDYSNDSGCENYYDNDESDGPVACTIDSDCGSSSTSTSCTESNDFRTTVTTPVCMNAGTEQSYCSSSTASNVQNCVSICSNALGCDYVGLVADLIANPQSGLAPLTVNFTANATGSGIVTYSWDFDASNGLQEQSTSRTPQVMYSVPGNYTVTLNVYSDGGLTGHVILSKVITVTSAYTHVPVSESLDPDMLIEHVYISNDGNVEAGEMVDFGFEYRNRGDINLNNVRISVSIPELGLSRTSQRISLDKKDSNVRHLTLWLPRDTPAGEYTARIVVFDGAVKRVQHRTITVN